jgi:hypothetical protein
VLPGHGARALRIAPDECLFVCEPAVADDVVREVRDRIAALDDDALVLDVSDGWAGARLLGDDPARAFSYVSQLDAPTADGDGFVQGHVAHVSAKVVADDEGLTILVPAYWGEHLRERLRHDVPVTEVQP